MIKAYTKEYKEYWERMLKNMIKAGIIGATGYAGGELVRLLLNHKEVEIKWYGSRSYIDKNTTRFTRTCSSW